ncbi:hypothetical protein PHLGIDRAFT_128335 [Phlebiopsis gigantea 11061_1 CR5-6]|uniref:Uncharacterized protein n=1 Tax=Phlebiopsis gigantea (strain 11061_1 CR5-6) TaxID=745531 RepID=A0A0C3RX64_PHLG1|nr:hypothetical protein PHLGIDRAFT_128335 [Phlebiopsis gigantea 11061_1 CR5-6]
MPPAHRRSKSDADLKYAAADPNPALTNLFRREPEVSSSKSTQALQNLVVNLESQLGEAYHEIRVVCEERDEMARERDEQRQILYDAERQMDDILHRHHHGPHLKQYMDDLRHLHEMIYSYEASLLEAGIEPPALHYRSSIEVLRSQLHFPIKAPRGHPSHATTPLARFAYTHFVTPPLTPEPRAPTDLPEVVPDLLSAPLDSREAWGIPRCASPASLEEVL